MAVRTDEITTLGFELAEREVSEAALRAAVGRMYYGLLIMLRDAWRIPNRRANVHDAVAAQLGRKTRRMTRTLLIELRDLREKADYEPGNGNWQRNVTRARRIHDQIIEELLKRRLVKADDYSPTSPD